MEHLLGFMCFGDYNARTLTFNVYVDCQRYETDEKWQTRGAHS
jgi:hypothetical protein